MIRKLTLLFVSFIVLMLLIVAFNLYLNNKDAQWPDNQQIDSALIKSIEWLKTNQSTIESIHSPGPWWILKEASDITDKPELIEIFSHYKTNYLDRRPPNIWTPYFQPTFKPRAPDILEILDLEKYQIFFIYALTCGTDLASEPLVQQQGKADFCSPYFLHPRCVTHQQMGVRLLQRSNCGDQEKLASLSSELVNIIHFEITWDFRVGDAYIQRNLMLAEAGRMDLIKAVWIQRILEAQNPDGGWDDIHPIISFRDNNIFGLSSKLPTFKNSKSNFHATSQAIWLLSLLQQYANNKISTMGTATQ